MRGSLPKYTLLHTSWYSYHSNLVWCLDKRFRQHLEQALSHLWYLIVSIRISLKLPYIYNETKHDVHTFANSRQKQACGQNCLSSKTWSKLCAIVHWPEWFQMSQRHCVNRCVPISDKNVYSQHLKQASCRCPLAWMAWMVLTFACNKCHNSMCANFRQKCLQSSNNRRASLVPLSVCLNGLNICL